MKSKITILLLALTLGLGSCSKDNESINNNNNPSSSNKEIVFVERFMKGTVNSSIIIDKEHPGGYIAIDMPTWNVDYKDAHFDSYNFSNGISVICTGSSNHTITGEKSIIFTKSLNLEPGIRYRATFECTENIDNLKSHIKCGVSNSSSNTLEVTSTPPFTYIEFTGYFNTKLYFKITRSFPECKHQIYEHVMTLKSLTVEKI